MQRTTGLLATAVAAEQEAAAASERRAERKAARSERRDPFSLQGVELMRAVECAVRRNRAARQMPDTEQEALAQMVAERVIVRTGERRGNARAVLAAIGRAERHPLTYAREESQRVERSGAGRELLDRIVTSLVAQSRDWRDTLDRYRTRKQAQADTGPMIGRSRGSRPVGGRGRSGPHPERASARPLARRGNPPRPLPGPARAGAPGARLRRAGGSDGPGNGRPAYPDPRGAGSARWVRPGRARVCASRQSGRPCHDCPLRAPVGRAASAGPARHPRPP
jgi:hypothetical protein